MTEADAAIAVLDIGKSNVKLAIVGRADGSELYTVSTPNLVRPGPPYRHHDVAALQDFFLAALRNAPCRERITALVPVAHGAAATVMAGGALALPVMDYEDPELESVAVAYRAERPDFAETKSPDLPFGLNLGRQLFLQQTRHTDAFLRATAILPYAQFWSALLSGIAASEVSSLGCHTDLWQPASATFSSLATRWRWDRLFAPMRRADAVLGPVRSEIAQATGLRANCLVHVGIHDSNASYLCHRLTHGDGEAFTVLSTGTWIIAMAAGANLERVGSAPDTLTNVDVFGAAVPTIRFMGGREYAVLSRYSEGETQAPAPDATPSYGFAETASLMAASVRALPAFAPAGPFGGQDGRIEGNAPDDRASRHALASLYCALMSDAALDMIGARGDLVVEGPFAGNPLFCALLAGLRPATRVTVSSAFGGTLSGARLLATGVPSRMPTGLTHVKPWSGDDLARERTLWRDASGVSIQPP